MSPYPQQKNDSNRAIYFYKKYNAQCAHKKRRQRSMKKRKKLVAAVLAALVVSQSMTALANPSDNNPKGDEHTTIGIMEATSEVGQASFEVPLYVTTAAISDKAELMCPEGYDIKNTSKGNDAHNIGVLSVSVERIGTWDTVEGTPNGKNEVKLTIGELVLPAVNGTTKKQTVDIRTDAKGKASVFYGRTTGKLDKVTAIEKGKTLAEAVNGVAPTAANYKGLTIEGTVQNTTRNNKKAAAQFRVTYVVSALDDNGDPIGNTYVGDDKTAAGLQ